MLTRTFKHQPVHPQALPLLDLFKRGRPARTETESELVLSPPILLLFELDKALHQEKKKLAIFYSKLSGSHGVPFTELPHLDAAASGFSQDSSNTIFLHRGVELCQVFVKGEQ
jgi:hypothetical protein